MQRDGQQNWERIDREGLDHTREIKGVHTRDAFAERTREENGAAGRIRTHDPLVRSQVLYPTELRARGP